MSKGTSKLIVSFIILMGGAAFGAESDDVTESRTLEPRPIAEVSEYKPHIGLFLGVANPEGAASPSENIAVDAGFQFYIPFSAGIEFSQQKFDNAKADNTTLNRSNLFLKSYYNFSGSGFLGNTYAGAAFGVVWEDSSSYAGFAPLVGFDHILSNEKVSLGAEARYAIVSSNGPDALALNGAVKYWF